MGVSQKWNGTFLCSIISNMKHIQYAADLDVSITGLCCLLWVGNISLLRAETSLSVIVMRCLWCRDCFEVIHRIHSFLKLDLKHAQAGITPTLDLPQKEVLLFAAERAQPSQASDDAASATSSEESFELVGTADVAEYDPVATDEKPPLVAPADPVSDQADEESLDPAVSGVKTSCSDDIPCQ